MRVLHIWDNYAPGLFDRSFEICRQEEIETSLVCMNLIADTEQPNVRFVRQITQSKAAAGFPQKILNRVVRAIEEHGFRRLVSDEVGRFRPDILHLHYGTTGALLAGETELLRIPFLVSFYGFDISQGVQDPSIKSAYRRMMRYRPLVHILCNQAESRAVDVGAEPDRIVDANLPLPVERYPYVGVDGSVSRWLMPARFVEKKGHEVAFRAFATHLERYPHHRLTCWGYGNSVGLRARVRELGLEPAVSIINNESEKPFDQAYLAQLRKHDAVLAPSVRAARGDDEGGPALTAVLAQVAGKPVILSDFPGSERSVSNGIEGFIVPQGDVAALNSAMEQLSGNLDLARGLGRRGRERALHEFSLDAYRNALLGWYRRLANGA